MPFDGPGVEKLCGHLLRYLRALRAGFLASGSGGQLYGIRTSAIREFEACGQRLRDPRVGRGPQKAGKRESGEANDRGVTLRRRQGGRSLASSAISSCWPMPIPLTRLPKHVSVDSQIERENEEPEYELDVSSECGGVEDWKHVLLDETAGVTSATCLAAQPVLQWRQRADPSGKLDRRSPNRRGDVKVCEPWPLEDEQPTQYHEQHEEEVNCDDEIG